MNLSVLVPSEEYRAYAGARIRYGRLGPELEKVGIHLSLQDIGSFDLEKDASDVLLISKCHDARSLLAAVAARQRGQLVGVDLFDDYFSQEADGRLSRFRNWLTQLLRVSDFALCSTRALAGVVARYDSALPVQVVNDPSPGSDPDELAGLLRSKLTRDANERTMRLGWFGVGDNPHFRVGLSDLSACAGLLRTLASAGTDIELTVSTNERALTADGLAMLADLPVRTRIEEWSEQGERALLASAFACILPVNAQAFSAAKSLNRAVTALSAGCQVISPGYPLYAALDDFIYRDGETFLRDFANRSMKHSAKRIDGFQATMASIASPAHEAAVIAKFLRGLERRLPDELPVALIHGQSTSGAAHKMVQALKGLSVASPYCATSMGFDVMFRDSTRGLTMLVSDSAAGRLNRRLRDRIQVSTTLFDKKFWVVPGNDGSAGDVASMREGWRSALPFQIGTYGPTMTRICERMKSAFGPCRMLISENSQLPFGPQS